jgi:DNA-binding transcriptional ArsR family regulator
MPSVYATRDLTFWYHQKSLLFFVSLASDNDESLEPSDMLLLSTSALNDKSRLKILKLLSRKNCTAGELSDALGLNASTVSRHLKVFKDTGLIDILSNDGRKIVYTFNHSGLESVMAIINKYLTGKE